MPLGAARAPEPYSGREEPQPGEARDPETSSKPPQKVLIAGGILALVLLGVVGKVGGGVLRQAKVDRLARSLAPGPMNWGEGPAYAVPVADLRGLGTDAASAAPQVAALLNNRVMVVEGYGFVIIETLVAMGPQPAVDALMAELEVIPTHLLMGVTLESSANFDYHAYALSKFAPHSTKRLIEALNANPESQLGRNAAYALAMQARGIDFMFGRERRRLTVTPNPAAVEALRAFEDSDDHDLARAANHALGYEEE